MDIRLILVLVLVFASVEVLGRKKRRKNKRKLSGRFPKPYSWMHYASNYDPTVEENGCVDIRPQCTRWAKFPGYCGYARGYMIRHCKKSCRLCRVEDEVSIGKTSGVGNSYINGICEDQLEDCRAYIKSQSQCDLFSGLMTKYCRKTCGFCCLDILNDCSLFIKRPSQCRGLNGFFRKYCPNTCQMCGIHLPIKKPGCQDELDDCKSFDLDQCQIHKAFCSKYCAKTCGFCEELGYSPQGTTQPVVDQQNTYGPSTKNTPREVSPSTPLGVTRTYQDAANTQGTTGDTQEQETFPAVTTTTPAGWGISSETTEMPHKAIPSTDPREDESTKTELKTEKITTPDEILQTTAPAITTESINIVRTTTSKLSTGGEDTTNKQAKTTSSEVDTEVAEPTLVTQKHSTAYITSLPTESTEGRSSEATEGRTSEATEATFSSAKTKTAPALETSTAKSFSEEAKTNSSRKTTEGTRYRSSLATSALLSETETAFPTTSDSTVSESPSLAQASSPKIQTTASGPETAIILEQIATDHASTPANQEAEGTTAPSVLDRVPTVNTTRSTGKLDTDAPDRTSTVKSDAKQETKGTTAPSILDGVPTVNTARSTTNLDTDGSSPGPRVTTDISSTARPDNDISNPSTITPVPDVSSPTTKKKGTSVPALNTGSPVQDVSSPTTSTGSPDSEAPSTEKPNTDIESTTTSGKVTATPASVEESTGSVAPSTAELPSTGSSSIVTESQDVIVNGQYVSTTVPLGTKEQNIDGVVTTREPTVRSHLRSKTRKKSVCVDRLKECAGYVAENINFCKYHVHFMHEYCSKSCGFCGQDKADIPKCEDERKKKCEYFSRYVGYCTVNRKYMKRRCPKSCGFCSVAPGSPPIDRTFVRTDQKYEFSIMTQWDGTPITHAPIKFKLSAEDNTNVRLEVSGPFFNQSGPPQCAAGQPCWQLWNYEVAEMFFLGEKEKYLELEVSPHGPHLLLLLDGVRKPFKTKLPMRYSASVDLSSMTWSGTAIIPLDYFPPGMRKINAYAIHGPNSNKIYESLYPASKTAYPDFHRLEFFKAFDFKSMFPSGWNQPISPLWLTSK